MKRLLPVFALALAACGGGEEASSPPAELPDSAPAGVPSAGGATDGASGGIRPADGVYPFQGRWANDFSDCALPLGSAPEAPILIEPGAMTGYENRCELTGVTPVDEAEGIYNVRRLCSGEGVQSEDQVQFDADGETLTMRTSNGGVTWTRCPIPGDDPDE